MSKRVPELGQTADDLVGAAAEFGIHGSPRLKGERNIPLSTSIADAPKSETRNAFQVLTTASQRSQEQQQIRQLLLAQLLF
jgi:hypothetical protein